MVTGWTSRSWRLPAVVAGLLLGSLAFARTADARQLGALVSPGALSQPHATLEGIRNCEKCHEAGNRVTGAKCLSCHQPIADRIRARRGVHRTVAAGDCVTCHAEHQGATGELRPFDLSQFDHGRDAGYPLDGRHAPLAAKCASCHKTRSYLGVSTACASCHQDVHKGTLGATCETCHTTRTAFKEVRQGFDHSKAAFKLDGAHARVACESCHKNGQFKGVAFATCASCHRDPHTPKAAEACATCHTTATWRTRRFDHATTKFALAGKHATVACAGCHVRPALQVTPRYDTCASCHTDPHKGAFKQDCKACHNEQSFAKAPFDHTATAFPLTGRHAPAACTACHTSLARAAQRTGRTTAPATVDFGGLKKDCASCHDDVHRANLGAACESCHTTERFAVTTYTHRTPTSFFAEAHTPATCVSCHQRTGPAAVPDLVRARTSPPPVTAAAVSTNTATPVRGSLAGTVFTAASQACATCHADVHLGQVAATCESCHAVATPKFGVTSAFNHARTTFALNGKHAGVECRKCHTSQAGTFPAGAGTAVRLTGIATTCATCHADVHLGQLGARCESCHTDQTFKLSTYTHKNPAQRAFFVGPHTTAACSACHTPATGAFAAGTGTAVRYAVPTDCTACHRDVHNGTLGPKCADCHRLDRRARLAIPNALDGRRDAR
jgi:hypothetical protein